jgi:6,7-dimethyl-8-ribityllumazine synthase
VITIGCLIKGETMHFEYIAEAVAKGLMDVSVCVCGVCVCGNVWVLGIGEGDRKTVYERERERFPYACSFIYTHTYTHTHTHTKKKQIQLQTTIPVIFGLLTVLNEEQAISRSQGDNNHGVSWGKTAVEMALLRNAALSKGPDRVCICVCVDVCVFM